jgi:membrane-associated phospholipid phosphatase
MSGSRSSWPAGLVVLGLASVAGVVATFAVFVRTDYGQRIDQGAFEGRGIATTGAREAASDLLTTISVGSLVLAVALLVGQALVRRRTVLALVAAAVIVGSIVTTEILKDVLLRRPDLIGLAPFSNTFPSGHATIALGIGVAATLVVPPRLRRPIAFLAVAYAVAVGVALLAAGWHRPSDIAGGYFVVTAWAAAAALLAETLDRDAFRHEWEEWPRHPGALGYLLLGMAILVAGYLVAVGAALASDAGAIDWGLVNAAFLAACAAIASLAAVLMSALLAALRASMAPAAR